MVLYMCRRCGSVEKPEIFQAVDETIYICPNCGIGNSKFKQQFIPTVIKVDCYEEDLQILYARR